MEEELEKNQVCRLGMESVSKPPITAFQGGGSASKIAVKGGGFVNKVHESLVSDVKTWSHSDGVRKETRTKYRSFGGVSQEAGCSIGFTIFCWEKVIG